MASMQGRSPTQTLQLLAEELPFAARAEMPAATHLGSMYRISRRAPVPLGGWYR